MFSSYLVHIAIRSLGSDDMAMGRLGGLVFLFRVNIRYSSPTLEGGTFTA